MRMLMRLYRIIGRGSFLIFILVLLAYSRSNLLTDQQHPATTAVWAGEENKDFWQRATQTPVVHSVSFGYPDVDGWLDVALGNESGHIYGRNTNPTVAVFEEKVRLLEGAEAATSFSTGMAAISNTLFTLLAPGDRVVSVKDTYGGTNKLFTEFLPRLNVRGDALRHHRSRRDRGAKSRKAAPCSIWKRRPTRRSRSSIWRGWREQVTRRARSSWSTTPSPRRSTRIRWRWALIWCCTARPSSSAGTPTRSAASSADRKRWSSASTTTARSPARRSTRWRPICCCAA